MIKFLLFLASAIPIALIVNSIRITITGLLFQVADSEFAERVFHDWAGMVMMPMASVLGASAVMNMLLVTMLADAVLAFERSNKVTRN